MRSPPREKAMLERKRLLSLFRGSREVTVEKSKTERKRLLSFFRGSVESKNNDDSQKTVLW